MSVKGKEAIQHGLHIVNPFSHPNEDLSDIFLLLRCTRGILCNGVAALCDLLCLGTK